jgi:adenosylcobinamide kinase/adenosylcobinamide-phosphate guanylyltransferase
MPTPINHSGDAKIHLILGGARSGKSTYAETLAETFQDKIYLATADHNTSNQDDEMSARIRAHQIRRGEYWRTIEEPVTIYDRISDESQSGNVILIDCLTLWLSNLMFKELSLELHQNRLLESLKNVEGHIIMVSNEVGLSIVPENALARRFRDEQGRLNQTLAKAADNVVFIAAGLPLTLKG